LTFRQENTLRYDIVSSIEKVVDNLKAQAGHTNIIFVGICKGNGKPTAPIFFYGALFFGQPIPIEGNNFAGHVFCYRKKVLSLL